MECKSPEIVLNSTTAVRKILLYADHTSVTLHATRHSTGSVCVPLAAVQGRVSSVPTRIVRLNSLTAVPLQSFPITRSPPCPQQINCRLWRYCTYWAGAAASTSVAVPQPSCCCCAVVRAAQLLLYTAVLFTAVCSVYSLCSSGCVCTAAQQHSAKCFRCTGYLRTRYLARVIVISLHLS